MDLVKFVKRGERSSTKLFFSPKKKVCQIVTEFAETRRVSCSDSVDENGAIYIGLCERKLNSKQKQTAESVEVSQPHNVYTCQCKDGFG